MSEISKLPNSVNIPSTTSELSGSTPHNIEAEQALLGALMINNDVFDRIDNIVNETHSPYFSMPSLKMSIIIGLISKGTLARLATS